jgi:hypothetical protein
MFALVKIVFCWDCPPRHCRQDTLPIDAFRC